MDKPELSPCRTCGKEISTNLYGGSFWTNGRGGVTETAPQGCPNCGEAEPHITVEEVEEAEKLEKELQEKVQRSNFSCLIWTLSAFGIGAIAVGWLVLRILG